MIAGVVITGMTDCSSLSRSESRNQTRMPLARPVGRAGSRARSGMRPPRAGDQRPGVGGCRIQCDENLKPDSEFS
jgi:hypothetical protein